MHDLFINPACAAPGKYIDDTRDFPDIIREDAPDVRVEVYSHPVTGLTDS